MWDQAVIDSADLSVMDVGPFCEVFFAPSTAQTTSRCPSLQLDYDRPKPQGKLLRHDSQLDSHSRSPIYPRPGRGGGRASSETFCQQDGTRTGLPRSAGPMRLSGSSRLQRTSKEVGEGASRIPELSTPLYPQQAPTPAYIINITNTIKTLPSDSLTNQRTHWKSLVTSRPSA